MSGGSYRRGDVVWHPAPFKRGPKKRPYLILSDSSHPFHGAEYPVVGLTRTDRPSAVALDEQSWEVGTPGGDSYASPWYVFTIKHEDVIRPKGALTTAATDDVAKATAAMLGVS